MIMSRPTPLALKKPHQTQKAVVRQKEQEPPDEPAFNKSSSAALALRCLDPVVSKSEEEEYQKYVSTRWLFHYCLLLHPDTLTNAKTCLIHQYLNYPVQATGKSIQTQFISQRVASQTHGTITTSHHPKSLRHILKEEKGDNCRSNYICLQSRLSRHSKIYSRKRTGQRQEASAMLHYLVQFLVELCGIECWLHTFYLPSSFQYQ